MSERDLKQRRRGVMLVDGVGTGSSGQLSGNWRP